MVLDELLSMIDIAAFIEVFIPLFIIINPLAILPNFIELTQRLDKKQRGSVSFRTSASAFILLCIFVFIGRPVLGLIGVSTAAFMMACGILVLYISLGMLSGDPPVTRNVEFDRISVVPMSIPLLAGPGAIATTIVLEGTYGKPLVLFSLVITMVLSKVMLDYYRQIVRVMGKNGLNAWIRLSALFFAAIAVNLITKGILEIGW